MYSLSSHVMYTEHLLMYSLGVVSLTDKYAEIEKQLIDNFKRAYYDGDLQRMKNITTILSNFKVTFEILLTAAAAFLQCCLWF